MGITVEQHLQKIHVDCPESVDRYSGSLLTRNVCMSLWFCFQENIQVYTVDDAVKIFIVISTCLSNA